MEVLACLAERPGQVLSKDTIIQRVWGDTFVTDDVLIRAISELRRALEDDRKNPSFIRTIPKRGYQLVGTVDLINEGMNGVSGEGRHLRDGNSGGPENGNESHHEYGRRRGSGNGNPPGFPDSSSLQPSIKVDGWPKFEPTPASRTERETVSVPDARKTIHPGSKSLLLRQVIGAVPFSLVLLLAYCWYQGSLVHPRVTRIVQLTDTGRPKLGELATDGSRIFFSEYRDGHSSLTSVSVSGGETVPIECPFPDVRVLDISPDGMDLLISELSSPELEKPVWIVPVAGGAPRRLGNVNVYHTSGAAWSPGGERIAYSTLSHSPPDPGGAIYIVGTDGLNPEKLLATPSPVYQIRWSPDSSVLRFSLGNNRWGEVGADGSSPRSMLPGGQNSPLQNRESNGTWTPDGKYFFFTSQWQGLQHLWVLEDKGSFGNWAGAAPFRFTPGPFDVDRPLASRDGKRVFCTGGAPRARLSRYVRETRVLEPYLAGVSAEMPDFSRDGEWVVYVTLPDANLVRSRVDGRDRLQLTSPPIQVTLPTWSPDGKEIAFIARRPGELEFKIYLVSASGSNLRPLLPGLGPTWSPDGRYLLFEHWDPSNPDSLRILDLKTDLVTEVPGSENKTAPRWSPDGRYIVATAEEWSRVVVFDLETRAWRTLTTYGGGLGSKENRKGSGDGVFFPTWSHDGQSVFYIEWTPGSAGIHRIGLSGGEPETILDFADPRTPPWRHYSGTLGGWFGLASDDSILIAVHAGEEEIYAIEWEQG